MIFVVILLHKLASIKLRYIIHYDINIIVQYLWIQSHHISIIKLPNILHYFTFTIAIQFYSKTMRKWRARTSSTKWWLIFIICTRCFIIFISAICICICIDVFGFYFYILLSVIYEIVVILRFVCWVLFLGSG